jgi:hypothetical protein
MIKLLHLLDFSQGGAKKTLSRNGPHILPNVTTKNNSGRALSDLQIYQVAVYEQTLIRPFLEKSSSESYPRRGFHLPLRDESEVYRRYPIGMSSKCRAFLLVTPCLSGARD